MDGRRAPHVLSSEYKNPHGCFLDKVVRSIGLIIGNRVCARRKKKKKRTKVALLTLSSKVMEADAPVPLLCVPPNVAGEPPGPADVIYF